MNKIKFYFFSLGVEGIGISGSDRIFIELARNWSKKITLTVFTTEEGVKMMERQNLSGKYLKIKNLSKKLPKNFFLKYLYKIFLGIKLGFSLDLKKEIGTGKQAYLYSASEFWMDSFPALILKLRFPKVKWVATWYQTAPNPFKGFAEGKRGSKYRVKALLYWIAQLPVRPLINRFADKVIVNNEDEKRRYPKHTKRGDTVVLIGAVRLDDIENWKSKMGKLEKKYDAVFQGRFHPQKGVVELIDIWKMVVKEIPGAKLAMIGDGPLMESVKNSVSKFGLAKNVRLFGYVFDGQKKYEIFAKSKIVVHPAFYDSGGMASAEAMAFGLPVVGFNLISYKSYYPKGMLKAKTGDVNAFAKIIVKLLKDSLLRQKVGKEALKMIRDNYSWSKRSKDLVDSIAS